ncbi:MAG: EpsG family protein [Natronospirillum sp.]
MAFSLVFYNAILLLSTLFVWLSEKASTPMQRKVCTLIAFLIVFLPAALRYEIGIDYFSYKIIFENIRDGLDPFWQSKMEPGYYFLNWIVASIGLPYEALVALCSFIIFLFFFKSYPLKNKYLIHFILISLLYFTANNLIRNWMALSIAWYGVARFATDKSLIKYLVLILISALFHKSSLLLVVLALPFVNFKVLKEYKKLLNIFLLCLAIILFLYGQDVFRALLSGSVANALGYASYATSWYAQDTELGTGFGVVFYTVFLLVSLLALKDESSHYFKVVYISIAIAVVIQIAAAQIHIFGRLKYVFFYAFFLAFLILLKNRFLPFRTLAYMLLLISLYNFNNSILQGSTDYMETCRGGRITPYVSVFNKEDSNRDPYLTSRYNWCDAYFENK